LVGGLNRACQFVKLVIRYTRNFDGQDLNATCP
jgi:hypothetical protein